MSLEQILKQFCDEETNNCVRELKAACHNFFDSGSFEKALKDIPEKIEIAAKKIDEYKSLSEELEQKLLLLNSIDPNINSEKSISDQDLRCLCTALQLETGKWNDLLAILKLLRDGGKQSNFSLRGLIQYIPPHQEPIKKLLFSETLGQDNHDRADPRKQINQMIPHQITYSDKTPETGFETLHKALRLLDIDNSVTLINLSNEYRQIILQPISIIEKRDQRIECILKPLKSFLQLKEWEYHRDVDNVASLLDTTNNLEYLEETLGKIEKLKAYVDTQLKNHQNHLSSNLKRELILLNIKSFDEYISKASVILKLKSLIERRSNIKLSDYKSIQEVQKIDLLPRAV